MAELSEQAAKFGDSTNTLLLKSAKTLWDSLADTTGLYGPAFGDTDNDLALKIAQYLERL